MSERVLLVLNPCAGQRRANKSLRRRSFAQFSTQIAGARRMSLRAAAIARIFSLRTLRSSTA